MKKLLLLAFGAALLSLGSCSTSAEKAQKNETEIAAKIQNCTNPDSLKVYVEEAKAYAQKLINEGKLDEAKKYLAEIEPVVNEKAPSLSGIFTTIKGAVDQIPDAAGNAADSIKAKADAAKDSIAAAANAKVEAGKEAIEAAAQAQKEKAAAAVNDAADKAKEKAADAANSAADKLKNALNK